MHKKGYLYTHSKMPAFIGGRCSFRTGSFTVFVSLLHKPISLFVHGLIAMHPPSVRPSVRLFVCSSRLRAHNLRTKGYRNFTRDIIFSGKRVKGRGHTRAGLIFESTNLKSDTIVGHQPVPTKISPSPPHPHQLWPHLHPIPMKFIPIPIKSAVFYILVLTT